ncbi:MAG: 3-phosphoshikimate 1-carboxyvinyltransferase, partial [Armatimonadetes bacterium]|nr:3-phosphoshikimate 1-carboxyvinyltransferase [Armatimonadota bacterium]
GELEGIVYHTPMASAQVKSAILLAGLNARGATTVIEPALSRDHTERMLRAMGARVETEGPAVTVQPPEELTAADFVVPGDFSSAAFAMAAGLLAPGSEVSVTGVLLNSTRTGLLEALELMGVSPAVSDEREVAGEPVGTVTVRPGPLMGAEIGGELIPRLIDEVPLLAVLATQAEGTTVIRDAAELRVKECDRLAAMAGVLTAMGAEVVEREDGLVIEGPTRLRGATVHSHGDHRVAMSVVVAGLVAGGETVVEDTDCISTSFPGFVELMQELGADCVEESD